MVRVTRRCCFIPPQVRIMRPSLLACFVVLAGFFANTARGQIIIQPNLFQSPLLLVENKDVQKDLKLADAQLTKLAELSKSYADSVRGLGFQDLDKRKKANAVAASGLQELLTASQAKRLKQLELQQRGAGVFGDPQIVKELDISPQQKSAIITTLQTFTPRYVKIFQGAKGNQQEIQKQLAALHREYTADIVKTLTKEQQAKWRDLAGPAFDGAFPSMLPVFVDMRPQPVLAWHMNDLNLALAEAKKTGKPIFATFRCEA